jgi:hypothetical protein
MDGATAMDGAMVTGQQQRQLTAQPCTIGSSARCCHPCQQQRHGGQRGGVDSRLPCGVCERILQSGEYWSFGGSTFDCTMKVVST